MIYYLKINNFGEYEEHSDIIYLSGDMYAVKLFNSTCYNNYYVCAYQPDNYDLTYRSLQPALFTFLVKKLTLRNVFKRVCEAISASSCILSTSSQLLSRDSVLFLFNFPEPFAIKGVSAYMESVSYLSGRCSLGVLRGSTHSFENVWASDSWPYGHYPVLV